jgi:hypothetical protein
MDQVCRHALAEEHIDDLIRMALDEDLHWAESSSSEVWAPIHAWRALGQLRAEAAIEPLLSLLDRIDLHNDDWVGEDLPGVFGIIGPAAIPGLTRVLGDVERGTWARVAACRGLVAIVERFPETRERAVEIVTDQLRRFAEQERGLNAFLVDGLVDLKAVESAGLIEEAYAADTVDVVVLGDWEEAQILLGLLDQRITPRPHFLALEMGRHPFANTLPGGKEASSSHNAPPSIKAASSHKARNERKAKRKQAKAARKRNRRR